MIVLVDASSRVSIVANKVALYKGDCEMLALQFELEHPWVLKSTPLPSSFILHTWISRFEYLTLFLCILDLFINCYMMQCLYRLNDLSFGFWFVRHQWLMLSRFLHLLENCQWCGESSDNDYLVLKRCRMQLWLCQCRLDSSSWQSIAMGW